MAAFRRLGAYALSGVFAFSCCTKIKDLVSFRRAISDFGVPGKWTRLTAVTIVALEAIGTLLLLLERSRRVGALLVGVLSTVFTVVVSFSLFNDRRPVCRCFGEFSKEPIGIHTIWRNVTIVSMAAFVAFPVKGRNWSMRSMAEQRTWWTFSITLLSVANSIGLFWVLSRIGKLVSAMTQPSTNLIGQGESIPDVALEDPHSGNQLRLSEITSEQQRTILIFADEGCSACEGLFNLLEIESVLPPHLVIFRGSEGAAKTVASEHRNLGLMRIEDDRAFETIGVDGTPSAISVDERLTVGEIRALGTDATLRAMRQAATS